MQNIDISKLKNVKKSLTESEIFELNGILNSGEIYEKIIRLQKISWKIRRNFLIKIGIFLAIFMVVGIYSWLTKKEIFLVFLNIIATVILLWALFLVLYMITIIIRLGKWQDWDGFFSSGKNYGYLDAKKNFLTSISWYFSQEIRPISEKINEEKIIEYFQDYNIFGKNFSRYSLEDLFLLFSKSHEKILVGEWREYEKRRRRRGASWEILVQHKLFFFEHLSVSAQFSGKIAIIEKWATIRKLQQSFGILSRFILLFIFLVLMTWFLYFLFFTDSWKVFLEHEKWKELPISVILILLGIITYMVRFFFSYAPKLPKIHLQKSRFSQKFSVFSNDTSVVGDFFENPEIQQKFLHFSDASQYKNDVFLWKNEIIVIRNLPSDFLWFSYFSDVNTFIKSFVDFYIEQKNIQKFFEEMKIFYK